MYFCWHLFRLFWCFLVQPNFDLLFMLLAVQFTLFHPQKINSKEKLSNSITPCFVMVPFWETAAQTWILWVPLKIENSIKSSVGGKYGHGHGHEFYALPINRNYYPTRLLRLRSNMASDWDAKMVDQSQSPVGKVVWKKSALVAQ